MRRKSNAEKKICIGFCFVCIVAEKTFLHQIFDEYTKWLCNKIPAHSYFSMLFDNSLTANVGMNYKRCKQIKSKST